MRELLTNFTWAFTGEPQEMLIEDSRVLWRGPAHEGAYDSRRDLQGKYLLPKFIDAHCHVLPTGLDLQKLNLDECSAPEEVLDHVRDRLKETPGDKWLLAVHYDQTKFEDGKHLTRHELDKISTGVPILLRHVSGHASIANSAALAEAGIGEDVKNPTGGEFERDTSGRLNGVLLEHAHEQVSRAIPNPTLEEMVDAILRAGDKMAGLGIGCASDMMTGRFNLLQELEAYRLAAERGCKVKTRLYMQWSAVFGPYAVPRLELSDKIAALDGENCRVGGIKIFADGAIGSGTAAIYGRFLTHEGKGPVISRRSKSASQFVTEEVEVDGQLMYAPDRLKLMVKTADEAGHQVAIHSIGNYSTDLVMDAFEEVADPSKHRIEHAMILSDQQIDRLAALNCFVTMQPEFLMRFGHAYMRQLGPERASMLKRARSVKDAGIRLSFSSDRPIVAGDPKDGICTAVHRPAGFDPKEALTTLEAVLAYTVEGARVNGDIQTMGELLPGQHADYQLLDTPLEKLF